MENIDLNRTLKPTVKLLKLTYGIVPIVAGADKFANILTQWEQYLYPDTVTLLPFDPHTFMMIVGVIEIIAGIIVFWKPNVGGIIVACWLTLIAFVLIENGAYYDVAIRDLVMAIGVFSFVRLTEVSK